MNIVYRLVWSHAANGFVAVAETARAGKKKKTRGRSAVIATALISGAFPGLASAVDVDWADEISSYQFDAADYDKVINTGTAFKIDGPTSSGRSYASGTTLNIEGAIPDIDPGNNPGSRAVLSVDALADAAGADAGRITLAEARDANGKLTAITSDNIDEFTYSPDPANPQQNQELNVEVPGLEGSYQVLSVYDSSSFVSATDQYADQMTLPVYDPASAHIYNQFGIASVSSGGGTVNVNIGADTNGTTPIADATNTLDLLAKNSILIKTDGTGSAQSNANWLSDNYIHFRPAQVISNDLQHISAQSTQYNFDVTLPNYYEDDNGKVIAYGVKTFHVTNSADIAEVNDYLIGQGNYAGHSQVQYWLTKGVEVRGEVIDSAAEAQTIYNIIIQEMVAQKESTSIDFTWHVWEDMQSHTNNATLATGDLNVIYATGKNATGTVTTGGSLAVDGATAVMRGDKGAILTNDGAINAWRSEGASPTPVAMRITDATAINNGTLNAGLFIEKDGSNQNVNNAGSVAIQGDGASTIVNKGHINVAITDGATHNAEGITASDTTTAINDTGATIALTNNSHNGGGHAGGYAVHLSDAASFENKGTIYIGAKPVLDGSEPDAVDLVGSGDLSAGIYSSGSGEIHNASSGTISVLDNSRNAAGILIDGGTGKVTNDGVINVTGKLTNGAAAANYGMYVKDNAGQVTNNGNINIDGDNNIALNVQARNANASMTSTASSRITVGTAGDKGGSDLNPYTYRNYAVYAEGLNNHQSEVSLDSTIDLLSAGAIGVHARGNATVDIGADASLNFKNSQQIGYYAWGENAKINISNADINDSNQTDSILFVIDHGAAFNGASDAGTNYQLTVGGAGSVGVFANGINDMNDSDASNDIASRMTTGNATITVSGANAIGVKVSGGASGTINDGAINLAGNDTTAVSVDGRTFSIDGNNDNIAVPTNVISSAKIGSAIGQTGITGYDVAYGGNLTLDGNADILLDGDSSKGIVLHNGGSASVASDVAVNGSGDTGVEIRNGGSLSNSGAVSVTGSGDIGVDIQNGGSLTNNGSISVTGSDSVGVRIEGAGATVQQLGVVSADGGKAAVLLDGSGATLTVNGQGNHITAANGADGVRIDSTGASSFTASNTTIDVSGSGAGINNNADSSNINLNNVTINAADGPAIRTALTFNAEGNNNVLNVEGSGSGFAFMKDDGSNTSGNLTIGRGYIINGNGAGSTGVLAKTNGAVNSGSDITMGASAGAAIDAATATAITNSGNIVTASNTGSTIISPYATSFVNSGTINAEGQSNGEALIVLNGTVGNRSINNSGTITSASHTATVIDATGATNNTLSNSGVLTAADASALVIAMGAGNDTINLSAGTLTGRVETGDGNDRITVSGGTNTGDFLLGNGSDNVSLRGGNTTGNIQMGSGADSFSWTSGGYAGNVDFSGADGNDSATFGAVDLTNVGHVLSEGGSNSELTFNNTHATIGNFSDDLTRGTNIGTGWSALTLDGSATDITVIDDLLLSGTGQINVNNGATLRSGNSVSDGDDSTIHDYDISTSGNSLISFYGGNDQTYAGVISGSGGMERIGGGDTVLLGDNTYTGNTLIGSGSTLTLGDGGTAGSLSEVTNITDDGMLAVNHSDEVTLNGVISGSGGFSQDGTGTTRLGGDNTYADTTTVSNGTLLINGNQSGGGTTTVMTGAALGGYGTLGGAVVFQNGTMLTPGDNGAGTLTINGDLTLASDTNSQWQLGLNYQPGGKLNDLVEVKGDLTLDGDLNVDLTPGGAFLPGVYRLFNYDGELTDNTMEIKSLPDNNGGEYLIQTDVDHQVNLILNFVNPGSQLQFWDGADSSVHDDGSVDGGDGTWLSGEVTATNNWTKMTGRGNAPWSPTSFAVFSGTGGNVTIDNAEGRVIQSGMQFAVDGYHLSQANADSNLYFLRSLYDLDRTDVPVPKNTWAAEGETVADAYYVIRVGAGAAGADVTATIDANLIQDNLDPGVVRLVKTDPGRLILNGDNHITGGFEVRNGTLQVSKDSSLGDAGTSVTMMNGATFQAGADLQFNRKMLLDASGVVVVNGDELDPGNAGGVIDTNGYTLAMGDNTTSESEAILAGDGALKIVDTSDDPLHLDGLLELNHQNSYQGATLIEGKDGNGTLTVNANTTGALGKADTDVNITHEGELAFNNAADAQQHRVEVDGASLSFHDNSRAGSSAITLSNGSLARFDGRANGDRSTVNIATQDAELALAENADAGQSVITNSGLVSFADNAQARSATLDNQEGAKVDISAASGSSMFATLMADNQSGYTSIGSLSGAGDVELGAATLEEGALSRNDTISGVISGNGGNLVKTGSGTLVLEGDNSWTGTTSVEQGSLYINGNQQAATGQTSVDSGATLGGVGVIGGDVIVANNGHLTAGEAPHQVGELTINGDLTLSDNSQVDFELGQAYHPGGAWNDVITVKGDLNLDGKLNIDETANGNFDVGIYRIFNYDGELTDNTLDIGIAPEAADDLYVQTSIANQVNLINRTGYTLRFWDGAGGTDGELKNNGVIDGGDGVWQNSTGNDNWTTDQTDPDGSLNAPYSDGAFAIFGGNAGNVTVDNSLGDVVMGGAQFLVDGYVINDGVITVTNADTQIRVGDGSAEGMDFTTIFNSDITGSGGIRKTDAGTLILNGDNSYTGGTAISGGYLQVSEDKNLGALEGNITLRGGVLRYGDAFNTSREVVLAYGGGAIDTNGYDISLLNRVSGEGDLHKFGDGTLTLTQDSTFNGTTYVEQGTLQLGDGGTGGSVTSNIVDDSVLAINRSDAVVLNGDISGSGQLWQQGTGTTQLNGDNSWTGITLVENGTLEATSEDSFSAASSHIVSLNGTLATNGYNQNTADVINQGTIDLRGQEIGNSLTVHGDYSGLGGSVELSAQRQSAGYSDRLTIDGGDVSGTTLLKIDASHLGEPTTGDGIKVVEATNGATTTAQTTKDAFTLGPDGVVAGAWEYELFAGDAHGQGEDWYLRAGYRPDVPGFDTIASTVRQADLAVLGTLHLRVGDELEGSETKPASDKERFWARYIVKNVDQKLDDATSTSSSANYNGMQMGYDLWHNEKWRTGFYTTFMDTDSQVNGFTGMRGGAGYNSTFSTYLGGYATWTDSDGLYVDNVMQYGYHSVDLRNYADNSTTHPDGSSFAGSVEVGKPWYLGSSNWLLEPQAQLIWQYSDFGAVTMSDSAKSRVKIDSDLSVIGRVGGRMAVDLKTDYGNIKPYARVNYWQELTGGQDTVTWSNSANGSSATEMKTSQRYSAVEAGLGATWEFTPDVQAYSEVSKTWSTGGAITIDTDLSASVGMKIRF